MSSGKFIIGGVFIIAAAIASIPLFFHDYKKISNKINTSTSAILVQDKTFQNSEVLGKINGALINKSDLNAQERQSLFEAESQTYKIIENILAKRYFDISVKDYMKSKKITNISEAQQEYVQEKAVVTNEQVNKFLNENSEYPQLKDKTKEQQLSLVKTYLQNQAFNEYFRDLISKAIAKGEIEITGASKPITPQISIDVSNSPSKGSVNAPITIIEFADFQCPYCATAQPALNAILSQYKGKVRFVFKNYPLEQLHPEAIPAAIVAECAGKQGKYWEMHDGLFENHRNLGEETYKKLAKNINLNLDTFNNCRKDTNIHNKIKADSEYAQSLGINATPAFYINGTQIMGALPKSEFEKIINDELNRKK